MKLNKNFKNQYERMYNNGIDNSRIRPNEFKKVQSNHNQYQFQTPLIKKSISSNKIISASHSKNYENISCVPSTILKNKGEICYMDESLLRLGNSIKSSEDEQLARRSYESNNNINSTSKRGSVVESTQQIYPVENNESSHNFHMFQYNWTQNENGSLVHPQIQNSNDNDREAYISKSNSSNEESKRPLSKKTKRNSNKIKKSNTNSSIKLSDKRRSRSRKQLGTLRKSSESNGSKGSSRRVIFRDYNHPAKTSKNKQTVLVHQEINESGSIYDHQGITSVYNDEKENIACIHSPDPLKTDTNAGK